MKEPIVLQQPMTFSKKGKNMTAKKAAAPSPKVNFKVSPVESVFEVEVDGLPNTFWGSDVFKFSVSSDGSVTINDNEFSSKKQAAQALEAMATFLKK
jgi:hypothetical protein